MKQEEQKHNEPILEEQKSGSKNIDQRQTQKNRLHREEGFETPNDPSMEETRRLSEETHDLSN